MELREFQWYVRPTYAIMVKPTDGGNSLWKYGFHLPLFRVLVHPSRVYLLRVGRTVTKILHCEW